MAAMALPIALLVRMAKMNISEVPCGTVAYNAETGKYICDVTEHGQEVMILKGGRGGLGNYMFRTATNQTPRYAQPGEPMQEMQVILQLKLLADVGLVGFPNAGKSTLLSAVSAARPKIASYPFTTLEPSLGIVSYRGGRSFVMADIPGIIEGASEGKGIGLRFLRHIERNSLLLFLVSCESDNIAKDYRILLSELEKYNPQLLHKHRILAVSKCDIIDQELVDMLKAEIPEDIPTIFISSVSGFGIAELKDTIWNELNKKSNKIDFVPTDDGIAHQDLDVNSIPIVYPDMDTEEDIVPDGDNDTIYV